MYGSEPDPKTEEERGVAVEEGGEFSGVMKSSGLDSTGTSIRGVRGGWSGICLADGVFLAPGTFEECDMNWVVGGEKIPNFSSSQMLLWVSRN